MGAAAKAARKAQEDAAIAAKAKADMEAAKKAKEEADRAVLQEFMQAERAKAMQNYDDEPISPSSSRARYEQARREAEAKRLKESGSEGGGAEMYKDYMRQQRERGVGTPRTAKYKAEEDARLAALPPMQNAVWEWDVETANAACEEEGGILPLPNLTGSDMLIHGHYGLDKAKVDAIVRRAVFNFVRNQAAAENPYTSASPAMVHACWEWNEDEAAAALEEINVYPKQPVTGKELVRGEGGGLSEFEKEKVNLMLRQRAYTLQVEIGKEEEANAEADARKKSKETREEVEKQAEAKKQRWMP